MSLNLARRHSASVKRDNLFVKTVKARLILFDELRLNCPAAISRHVNPGLRRNIIAERFYFEIVNVIRRVRACRLDVDQQIRIAARILEFPGKRRLFIRIRRRQCNSVPLIIFALHRHLNFISRFAFRKFDGNRKFIRFASRKYFCAV